MPRLKLFLVTFLICMFFSSSFFASAAYAITCTASVTPNDSQPNLSEKTFSFTINNTSGADYIQWIKITKPLSGLSFVSGSITDWDKSFSSDTLTLQPAVDPLSAGSSLSPSITVSVANIGGQSGNWTVEASDYYEGDNPVTCTAASSGVLGLSVASNATDTTAPSISSISVSSITSSSAVISWTTDEESDTLVNYGTDYAGPYSNSNTSLTTSHSITVSQSIAANTTYTYQVCSKDASNNQACSSENLFTTSATSSSTSTATPTSTVTATSTSTSVASATATPTPRDSTAPKVSITTIIEDSYEEAPLIEGSATDNRVLDRIEFSEDGGNNWLLVDDEEYENDRKATFSFTPRIYEDGNYTIFARAIDEEGNIGVSSEIVIVIDRLPPRVGGNLVSLGPIPLLPNEDGAIITIPGLSQRITLSAIGGATSIDLFINESMSSLSISPETGLWSGALNLKNPGRYQLRTRAIDGAKNITERDLNQIIVANPGRVLKPNSEELVEKGTVTVYIQDPLTKLWSLWDAKTFGQENPQNLQDGTYSFFLPSGTYYMTITNTGNPNLTSKIFRVDSPQPMVSDFKLQHRKVFEIGPLKIPLPDFFSDKATVSFKSFKAEVDNNSLIDKNLPQFTLIGTGEGLSTREMVGERGVVTFINNWSPPSIEQLPVLDKYLSEKNVNHAIVAVEETLPSVTILKKRGNYKSQILIDKDGELVEDYNITSLPKHVFFDRRGVVKKVITGVLNEEEISRYLEEI